MADPDPLPDLLPPGLTSTYISCLSSCGLKFHTLQAGTPGLPLVLFCHGFPELAFSWRKVLGPVAAAGYFCVAMDMRGYGRTTTVDGKTAGCVPYDEVDLAEFATTNLVRDLVCLVHALGYERCACVVGHDFGAIPAAMAALMRPDLFAASVQMSLPCHGGPAWRDGQDKEKEEVKKEEEEDIHEALKKLEPPRKHYKWYNSSPSAAADWAAGLPADKASPGGLAPFLRGYFHLKSADYEPNRHAGPLPAWNAAVLSRLPGYYIMPLSSTMPLVVGDLLAQLPSPHSLKRSEAWLSPRDLAFYVSEWERTGFQGALNGYRAQTASALAEKDMWLFKGKRQEVPCMFVGGAADWGCFQVPGALEGYEDGRGVRSGRYWGREMVEGAGHWVAQERPLEVVGVLWRFLEGVRGKGGKSEKGERKK